VIFFGPNLPGWHNVPLREILSGRLNRRVALGNDANCAALGEAHFGAARGARHVIYVALGTGVGGGVIAHGQLIEGWHGLGGELGHISVDPSGPHCHCGGIGCIESYAGGWAIARDGALLARSGRSDEIARRAAGNEVTAEIVAEAANAGDHEARAVFDRAGLALAVGLGGLVNVFNPEMIVVGGGLAESGDLILRPLEEALPRYCMRQIYPDVRILRSALGTHTGIYGAAARVFYAQEVVGEPT
jgi:glucokinase